MTLFAGCEGDPLESDPVDSGPASDATFDASPDTSTGDGGSDSADASTDDGVPDTALDATSEDADATSEDADATGEDADATSEDADATSEDADATGEDADATSDDADASEDADATSDDADASEDADATSDDADASEDADATSEDADATSEDDADATVVDSEAGDDETGVVDAAGGSDGGAPVEAEVWVVRVGDGVSDLASRVSPVVIERVRLASGALLGEIALPTAAAGAHHALQIPGDNLTMGLLFRSGDERYVTLVGYDGAAGTESATPGVLRTIARIDASHAVDTTTTTTSYESSVVRAAVTWDGNQYWIAGQKPSEAGIRYVAAHGTSGEATPISTGLSNARSVSFVNGALVGTAWNGSLRIFDFGGTRPTTETTPLSLPGMPTTSIMPYVVVGVPGMPDVLYVCDERSPVSGGGVVRWKRSEGTWMLDQNLFTGLSHGCRSLVASPAPGGVRLVASASQTSGKILTGLDTGTGVPTFTELRSAPEKTAYRGLAFAPR